MKRTDGVDVGTPSDHAAAKRQRVMDEGPLDEFQGLKGHLLVEAVFGKYGAGTATIPWLLNGKERAIKPDSTNRPIMESLAEAYADRILTSGLNVDCSGFLVWIFGAQLRANGFWTGGWSCISLRGSSRKMLFIFQVGSPIIRRPYLRMPSTSQRDSQSRILLKWGLNQVAYIQTCYIYIYIYYIIYNISISKSICTLVSRSRASLLIIAQLAGSLDSRYTSHRSAIGFGR